MFESRPDSDLVVETPELVSFQYEVAGLGTRFVAQLIDACLLLAVLIEVVLLGVLLAQVTSPAAGVAGGLLLGLATVWGYFLGFELAWSGQTPGKRAVGVRVSGLQGEPASTGAIVIRNLLRLVDFLPAYYGVGVITMFVNRRGRRLGDLAAGTLVVRERERLSLGSLQARTADEAPVGGGPIAALEPNLKRLVMAYAARRHQLSPERRAAIAVQASGPLQAAAPADFAQHGPLLALDRLADLAAAAAAPVRPAAPRGTSMALGMGIAACVSAAFCMPLVLVFGPLAIWSRQRAVRALEADAGARLSARAVADTGRLLGVAGLVAGLAVMATFGLLLLLSRG